LECGPPATSVELFLFLGAQSMASLACRWIAAGTCGVGMLAAVMGNTMAAPAAVAAKQPVPKKPVLVPGTGSIAKDMGDDFESEKWVWNYRHPKSSEEQDKRVRSPIGKSVNGKWFEGMKRGTPDVVKRIPLPSPGLAGSEYGLLIASLHTGIPGRPSYKMEQDDLIYMPNAHLGAGCRWQIVRVW